jgi:anti-anti-sigma factor
MSDSLPSWFDRAEAQLVDGLARRLLARAGSAYRALGEAAVRAVAVRVVAALRRDVEAAKQTALREVLSELIDELTPRGIVFADLKLLATATRQTMSAELRATPPDEATRERADEWAFQLALLAAQRFVTERERVFHEQAAQLEVRQLEHQLSELSAAYEEKTRLLDLIRQASTPIAPVHDGILVVPLVGMFDSERAQLLTEKLLAGISEARAQVVILDVSGVPVFDAEAAHHIVRTSSAVRLLGARLILVGLSPTIARTIIELGVDLSGLTTLSTLQAGLARALALRKLRIVAS